LIKDILITFSVGLGTGMISFWVLTFLKGNDALYFIPAPPTWAGVAGIVGIVVGAKILQALIGG